MNGPQFDEVDRAILYHLQQNARKPITDIADAVNVSDNTVRNRLQALEEAGVIRGYSVDLDYDKAGVQHHYVFTCTARVSRREQLAEKARELTGVTEVITLMTGQSNVLIIGVSAHKNDISDLAYAVDELGLQIEHEHLIREHTHKALEEFNHPQFD